MRLDERADLKAEKNENENGREASFTKLFKNKQEQIMKKRIKERATLQRRRRKLRKKNKREIRSKKLFKKKQEQNDETRMKERAALERRRTK